VALNCAGTERAGIEPFGPFFRKAKDAGLDSVPHAGEWAGPQNWETLRAFAPDRIGHGVRAIDDPRLVATLAERAIPLEVSPLSNVATGVYASLDEHPFMRLREAGVIVTLNSDDPPMFGAWVEQVYGAARDAWSLDDAALASIARAAVDASFADDATKRAVATGIEGWLATEQARRDHDSSIVIELM
jgi:adenosine deaminase